MKRGLTMKRFIIILLIAFASPFLFVKDKESEEVEQRYDVIPDEAIRLRILANSDSEKDQQIKNIIRDEVKEEIDSWVGDMTDIEDARTYIKEHVEDLAKIINGTLQNEQVEQDFHVEYASDVPFPLKQYDDKLYPPGNYEAVLITLGEGKGANWWCVLFPPLCFVDFEYGSAIAEEEEEVEVKFFLFEWLGLS